MKEARNIFVIGLDRLKRYLLLAIATMIGAICLQLPGYPAEKISFNYGLLGFKIKVADLELFAKEGKVTRQLNFYLKRIPERQRERLQEFLQLSYDIDPVLVYRFSRTSVGTKMLQRVGEIIQIPHDTNGFYGLRGAVVQTAADPEGVNLVNFLKHFPTDIKLNLSELVKLLEQISKSETATKRFISQLPQPDTTTGLKSNLDSFPDLATLGQFSTTKQTLELYDRQRDRFLTTDLYLPQTDSSTPIILVSNGLGAKRDRFEELAQHLASHGFAVAIPDHAGSDRQRQKAFLQGLYRENFDATDFIDRPLDMSFILDELTKINQNKLKNQLNIDRVGIFGYSLGGATALSLAGAEINFSQLQQDCNQRLNLLNISILYQCRALELPPQQRSLKDNRIKAAYLFVPFGKSLFGEEQLSQVEIPIIWQAVDRDYLTSLLVEQVPAFNSLTRSDRYLVISEKLPHTTATLGRKQAKSKANTAKIAKEYQNILSLAFFKTHIAQNDEYSSYLSSDYLQAIAQEPYNLHLLKKQKSH